MIWALAFAILFKVLGGNSPFMVPKLDNYVKTHVVDDSRKDKILDYLDEAKSLRKKTVKANKSFFKEFTKLEKSRDAKQNDFDELIAKIVEAQKESQNANVTDIQKSQEFITEDEWSAIKVDIGKGFEKSAKKRAKEINKLNKEFEKWEGKISKTIADKEKREQAIAAVEKLKNTYIDTKNKIQKELINSNSIIYNYKAPEERLVSLQKNYLEWMKEVLDTGAATHLKLVELTTPEEWNKIM
jgi:vacuolar-type H+-ATPase subunit I/STV1